MGQKGFFDFERRLEVISAKGDPLERSRGSCHGRISALTSRP
jgi:hypothetical protein